MRLAERVSPSNESNEFATFPVHASKDIPNRIGGTLRIRLTHGTLGIDVNESQSVLAEGIRASTVDLAMGKLVLLWCRTQRERLTIVLNVDAACAESKHWAAHGFDRYRARCSKEVAPTQTIPVLGLDGCQETTGFVEVGIVGP